MDEVRLNILKAQLSTMDKVNPIRANEIRKSIQGELSKSGEGSRGGLVIGHTKSGKPIYDNPHHEEHRHFTKEDHLKAAELHKKRADLRFKASEKNEGNNRSLANKNEQVGMDYEGRAKKHRELADKKSKEKSGKHPEQIRQEKREKEQRMLDKMYGRS